jgi:flagellar basal body-associated protein FliL
VSVADDTETKDETKTEAGPKKRLRKVVVVAVAAALAGAGVVVAVPGHAPSAAAAPPPPPPPPALVQVQHPDALDLQCNPRTQAGKAYLHAAFYFVYTVREDREAAAFESIRAHWDRARSNALLLLRGRTLAELQSDNGHAILTKDLVDELDSTLFPGRAADKVARVTEILWSKWMVQ